MSAAYGIADLRAHITTLNELLANKQQDPAWTGQPLDALVQRLGELDEAAVRLAFESR